MERRTTFTRPVISFSFFFFCELNIIHVTQNVNERERERERERRGVKREFDILCWYLESRVEEGKLFRG